MPNKIPQSAIPIPTSFLRALGDLCGKILPLLLVIGLLLFTPIVAQAQPPGVEPGESYHVIFATASLFGISSDPNFPPPPTEINGLPGADWHVTSAAFSSGLLTEWNGQDTPYTAILSTSTVNANTRFPISGKIYNTADEKVADDFADFWDGSLDAAIRHDEFGVKVPTSEVWSGSTSLGSFSGSSCGNWTDNSTTGDFGDASLDDTSWLNFGSHNYSNATRLYGISPAFTLPASADFNGDNLVDGSDFLTWQQNAGTVGPLATHANGDANGDDFINDADLAIWETQYGIGPVFTLPDSADFNGDNLVDGSDFLTWQQNAGTVGPQATHANGNANGDDFIDDADLAIWETQYGGAPPATALLATIPEPSTAMLILFPLAGLLFFRHREHREIGFWNAELPNMIPQFAIPIPTSFLRNLCELCGKK